MRVREFEIDSLRNEDLEKVVHLSNRMSRQMRPRHAPGSLEEFRMIAMLPGATTMVEPEHRGRAIGKWVKAEVNLAAKDRWPGAEWTETGNAFTNDAMLGINHAMGFRHEYTNTNVEVTVARAEVYLQKMR